MILHKLLPASVSLAVSKKCEFSAIVLGVFGGWSLSGFLAGAASLTALVLGGLNIYFLLRDRQKK